MEDFTCLCVQYDQEPKSRLILKISDTDVAKESVKYPTLSCVCANLTIEGVKGRCWNINTLYHSSPTTQRQPHTVQHCL